MNCLQPLSVCKGKCVIHEPSNNMVIGHGTVASPSPSKIEVNGEVLDNSISQYRPIKYRFSEDKILADLKAYYDKTYSSHYSNEEDNIQCVDAWIAMGDASPTFRNTAMKYLWRYGKKNGNNKSDLMKALHYIIFVLHNDHYKNK